MDRILAAIVLSAGASLLFACATPRSTVRYEFFVPASPEDTWFGKVEDWQKRSQKDLRAAAASGGARNLLAAPPKSPNHNPPELSGLLRVKMGAFEVDEKRALAERINAWAQRQARAHYRVEGDRSDPSLDRWPTFQQLLSRNGDDCDGLDLITYQLLVEFGFPHAELYRAIVRRDRDQQHHMVTLWFDNPDDPWVLDATGAMSAPMVRFSSILGWTPMKVFNETSQYSVRAAGTRLSLVRE